MIDVRRRRHRRVLTAVAATVVAIALSACGGDDGGDPDDGGPPSPAVTTSTEILGAVLEAGDVIDVAGDVTGDVTGDGIDLAAVDGRPVVAWFWAPWCTICRAEGPMVADVAATYRDDVVLIGVPGRGSDADMQRFIDDTGTGSITHVADVGGDIWSEFGVFAQPAFAFVTTDGDVEVFVGSLGERALVERIEALIGT